MKNAFLLCFLAFVAVSCSSDDSNGVLQNDAVLIKKIVYSNPGVTDPNEVNYTYNGTKLLTAQIDNTVTVKYIYSGDLLTRINTFNNSDDLIQSSAFIYENGRLISATHIIPEADQGYRSEYSYNADGTISVNNFMGDGFSQNFVQNPGKFFLGDNEEISKYEEYNLGVSGTRTTTYLYDNKNNPYKNVMGFDKLLDQGGKYHNITMKVNTNSNNIATASQSFEYIYNEDDFPESAVRTRADGETIILFHYE
jgi:hypothetical protein